MKKIVPFKKDIIFENNISEITSISLEHTLKHTANLVEGTFTVSGEYKITDESLNTESFSYDLPFTINVDEKYVLDNVIMDIDDFYYEILNDNVLSVNIDVLLDNLDEQKIRCIEEEDIDEPIEKTSNSPASTYQSYTVYIVRDGDTVETILNNYNITKEDLSDYNDLTELKVGDKIIIPC